MSKPSDVDICNIALAPVSDQIISSLTAESREARLLNRYYNVSRRWLLGRFDWAFARRRKKLQQKATPANDTLFTYCYKLPSDCLTPRAIEPGRSQVEWEIYQDEIHTNVSEAYLVYTTDEDNTETFSTTFVDCLHRLISIYLAQPTTADKNLRKDLREEFAAFYSENVLDEAEKGNEYLYSDSDPRNAPWAQEYFSMTDDEILNRRLDQTNL